jgi:tRNA threonylcarbamoyl adenosine modification protein YeaZ
MKQLLAIDTATSLAVAAISGGKVLSAPSEHRHGSVLLGLLDELLGRPPTPAPRDLAAVVVGTGPGNFTGLRIGLATAKTIAYAAGVPLVGVPTPAALARATLDADPGLARDVTGRVRVAVLQPAGPNDRYLTIVDVDVEHGGADLLGPPRLVAPGESIQELTIGAIPVAIDLDTDDGIPRSARARGGEALAMLGRALLHLGAQRVAHGRFDDVAALVPTYVTLPRGVTDAAESMSWSPALR